MSDINISNYLNNRISSIGSKVESNSLFGSTLLGHNVLRNSNGQVSQQILYATLSTSTIAGRNVDVNSLTRNSTFNSVVSIISRSIAQLPFKIVHTDFNTGKTHNAQQFEGVGLRDKQKANQISALLKNPNNFQTRYEFLYQMVQWLLYTGESYNLIIRSADNPYASPIELYALDTSLLTQRISDARYPIYKLSSPVQMFGLNKGDELPYYSVCHFSESNWQGNSGFNRGIQVAELIALDSDIDVLANFIMVNSAKITGIFKTDKELNDTKWKALKTRLTTAFSELVSRKPNSKSNPGEPILLSDGASFQPVELAKLQDQDLFNVKMMTMKRICGLFGLPPALLGISESKFNNLGVATDEFYKLCLYPLSVLISEKLTASLLSGYPNLSIELSDRTLLSGTPLDAVNYVSAAIKSGVMTPNEGRNYLGMEDHDDGDGDDAFANNLVMPNASKSSYDEPAVKGTSPQDTGGGGGDSTRKRALLGGDRT